MRVKVKNLVSLLAKENSKVPSNILHAISSVKPSQLMDHDLFDFKNLEKFVENAPEVYEPIIEESMIEAEELV